MRFSSQLAIFSAVFLLAVACGSTRSNQGSCDNEITSASEPSVPAWTSAGTQCNVGGQQLFCGVGLSETSYSEQDARNDALMQARASLAEAIEVTVSSEQQLDTLTVNINDAEEFMRVAQSSIRTSTEQTLQQVDTSAVYYETYNDDSCTTYYKYWAVVTMTAEEYDAVVNAASRALAVVQGVLTDSRNLLAQGLIGQAIRVLGEGIATASGNDAQAGFIGWMVRDLRAIIDRTSFEVPQLVEANQTTGTEAPVRMNVRYTPVDGTQTLNAVGAPVEFRFGTLNGNDVRRAGSNATQNASTDANGVAEASIFNAQTAGPNVLRVNLDLYTELEDVRETVGEPWRNEIMDMIRYARDNFAQIAVNVSP